jgi:hypothetical protein
VRAYYAGGPWCSVGTGVFGTGGGVWGGNYTCYSGWADYRQRTGIVCDPGTVIKGGDGILYMCQLLQSAQVGQSATCAERCVLPNAKRWGVVMEATLRPLTVRERRRSMSIAPDVNDPEYWQQRAKEARLLAERMPTKRPSRRC